MSNKEQYLVKTEPFYQAQGREVALYEAAYHARLPVMVKGPTGCGKSRFVEYMAWKLGRPLITVADDGPGVAPDAIAHLFEPFFTTASTGTGLGLSIVKHVLMRHQATRVPSSCWPRAGCTLPWRGAWSTGSRAARRGCGR